MVKVVGGVNASLSGRLGVGLEDVDVLMQSEGSGGSYVALLSHRCLFGLLGS